MGWQTISYNWAWQLKSQPAQLWPYVADTQRFNQVTGLPTIDFTEVPLENGGSRRFGQFTFLGVSIRYEDYPFEWIKGHEFGNLRVFEAGPVARTYARLQLIPHQAGTLLRYEVEVTPANLLGRLAVPYQFGWKMRQDFGRMFLQIDRAIQDQHQPVFDFKVAPLTSLAQDRLKALSQTLAAQGYDQRWITHLADFIVREADPNLARIRPYVLADAWQAPRRDILELFLAAAKIGLLQLRWDVICPLCRGAKLSAPSLDRLQKGVHCATCNIDFETNFSDNVELTFAPHPQIRNVTEATYCIGGPMVTPHILLHQLLAPGETRTLSQLELETGHYRLRTQKPGVEQWLALNPNGRHEVDKLALRLERDAVAIDAAEHRLSLPSERQSRVGRAGRIEDEASSTPVLIRSLTITNPASYPQQLFIERADWYNNAATATRVTALQQFRDLFSDEVIRPDEEIGIQGMSILFSDLVGSTAMYNRWGDAASYALVREQFAFLQRVVRHNNGAIVKTIGDAIMAAFADPADGVGAALAIQQEIYDFNARHSEPLLIKLGLHYGPCIAVNLNGRLDYFGTTVNLAARLEGQSKGGDLVISEAVRTEPGVASVLDREPVMITPFETSIKGFDDHFCLYRVRYN
ncbi:MAG: adenylate/guanylate cyclase domain-containing protein [Anaerolineae bacterium]|nr:adenylate/guanylate cyclase domain-containing protein [Anaerolineae bacterium]